MARAKCTAASNHCWCKPYIQDSWLRNVVIASTESKLPRAATTGLAGIRLMSTCAWLGAFVHDAPGKPAPLWYISLGTLDSAAWLRFAGAEELRRNCRALKVKRGLQAATSCPSTRRTINKARRPTWWTPIHGGKIGNIINIPVGRY